MRIHIQPLDFKPQQKLIYFVHEHVARLTNFNASVSDASVVLKIEKSDSRENKVCEIRLSVAGCQFYASKHSSTFEEALLLTIEALRHQLARWKDSRGKRYRGVAMLELY